MKIKCKINYFLDIHRDKLKWPKNAMLGNYNIVLLGGKFCTYPRKGSTVNQSLRNPIDLLTESRGGLNIQRWFKYNDSVIVENYVKCKLSYL